MVGGVTHDERYTFSSLMSLLIEIEGKLRQLYEAMTKEIDEPKLKSLVSDYDRICMNRMDRMRKVRTESVVEFMLEPITDLRLADPVAKISAAIQNMSLGKLEKAITLERTISELYAVASPRIMQTSADAGELLATLSRESAERLHELEQYVKSS